MHSLCLSSLVVTLAALVPVLAAERPVEATPTSASRASYVFVRPIVARRDILYDLEASKEIDVVVANAGSNDVGPAAVKDPHNDLDNARNQMTAAESRIKGLLIDRKYDEVMNAATTPDLLNFAERFSGDAQIVRMAAMIKGYYTQAEDAKIRLEAIEQFRKLAIRVDGVLWASEGQKLAIIANEPQALGISKEVKRVATIINIDRDRVDFRFHHERSGRLFEFPVYVGEDSKDTQPTTKSR